MSMYFHNEDYIKTKATILSKAWKFPPDHVASTTLGLSPAAKHMVPNIQI